MFTNGSVLHPPIERRARFLIRDALFSHMTCFGPQDVSKHDTSRGMKRHLWISVTMLLPLR